MSAHSAIEKWEDEDHQCPQSKTHDLHQPQVTVKELHIRDFIFGLLECLLRIGMVPVLIIDLEGEVDIETVCENH